MLRARLLSARAQSLCPSACKRNLDYNKRKLYCLPDETRAVTKCDLTLPLTMTLLTGLGKKPLENKRVENIVGKGEIACTSNFSFSHNVL